MNRRNFIKLSATASAIGLTPIEINATLKPLLSMMECPDISNRKLILINLSGGNDGLNTVIPLNQYDLYSNLRPTLKIVNSGTNAYLKLDTSLNDDQQIGLHPALSGLKSIYDQGNLRVLQSVGYPAQNKSHFKSKDLYMTGNDGNSSNNGHNSGWIGRFMEQYYYEFLDDPFPMAVEMGSPKNSLGFHGVEEHGMGLNITGQDPSGYYSVLNGLGGTPPENIPNSDYGKELEFLINADKLSNKYAEAISTSFNKGKNAISYPSTNISDQLKTVARLISGDLQSKVFMVRLHGFDTHNSQAEELGNPIGNHYNLLKQLSEGIEAFLTDLSSQNLANDVVGLTFSEFGRKAKENGNLGTDHGRIAPMFVFGEPVGGGVSGSNPDLSEAGSSNNYQIETVQHDYRETFATLLKDYLGASKEIIDGSFFNHTSNRSFYDKPIENLIKDEFNVSKYCIKAPSQPPKDGKEWQIFPNPFEDKIILYSINELEQVEIEIFSSSGRFILKRTKNAVAGRLHLDLKNLKSGNYVLKLTYNGLSETHKIMKIK
ncbi:DUF1501 domain-containing protein [Urechidicola vernalis]|uniref:DUF1501 domain-containing protein n=1 Tax=Urechidicola vernalis TaxID=3075600 RepID=A0ABU2Y6B9_9FLAO|nr:DUF1501 domain-containing protein [Urechidicola sp. P050]MDT0553746.1 DUF1501 domain-containing protein [Urechidicola sp. P050]